MQPVVKARPKDTGLRYCSELTISGPFTINTSTRKETGFTLFDAISNKLRNKVTTSELPPDTEYTM